MQEVVALQIFLQKQVLVKPDFGGVEQAIGNVEEKNDLLASRQSRFIICC